MGKENGDSPGLDPLFPTFDPIPTNPYGHMTVGVFSDSTITVDGLNDSSKESPVALAQSLREINSMGGGRTFVGTDTTGKIAIPGVTFTGLTASAFTFIRPEDVGIAPNQIPPDKTNLTNGALSLYPMVFFRQGQKVRAFISQQDENPLGGTNSGNALEGAFPFVINDAPGWSQWVFCVDGTCISMLVKHPENSDYRRGRDIWEHVIMPLVADANNNKGQVYGYENFLDTDTLRRSVLTRMGYISYGRMMRLFDKTGTPIDPQPVYPPA